MIRFSIVQRRHGLDPTPRIPQLVDRLNRLNRSAILYRLNGDQLVYNVADEGRLTQFDRDMIRFIDDIRVVPLRFVSRTREFIDAHFLGTVDIDDLLNGSDHSLCMNLLHILVERFLTPNYEQRRQVFQQPHQAAILRERDYLRLILGDPTIRYTGERPRGNQYVFTFRSDRNYRVEHLFTTESGRTESNLFVVQGTNRVTLDNFLVRGRRF